MSSHFLDGISEVVAGGEDVLGGYYLADQSSSDHLARLHVLVCGFCHSVFHVLDEFKRYNQCFGSEFDGFLDHGQRIRIGK